MWAQSSSHYIYDEISFVLMNEIFFSCCSIADCNGVITALCYIIVVETQDHSSIHITQDNVMS